MSINLMLSQGCSIKLTFSVQSTSCRGFIEGCKVSGSVPEKEYFKYVEMEVLKWFSEVYKEAERDKC